MRRPVLTLSFAALVAAAALVPARGQTDTAPPVLVAFSFFPSFISVSGGGASVQVTFQVTDDLAGTAFAAATFTSPGSPVEFLGCSSTAPATGSPLDGTFQCELFFPQGSQTGIWRALEVELLDAAGNGRFYLATELQGLGFPTEITVATQPDAIPPSLEDFSFFPTSINTVEGPATVRAFFTASDDLSGLAWLKVAFADPGPLSVLRGCSSFVFAPQNGAQGGGTYDCDVEFPQFTEEGVWTVFNVDLSDAAGNTRSYTTAELIGLGVPTALTVTSVSDLNPPTLLGFSFTPGEIDTTAAAAAIAVSFHAADDLAGVALVEARFLRPGGAAGEAACGSAAPGSGDRWDGLYACDVPFARFSAEGSWPAEVEIRDQAGNAAVFDAAALGGMGFPTQAGIGYLPGPPRAGVATPAAGASARGDSLTIRGRLLQGSPADVSPTSGVRFDYRPLPFGTFMPIPAADPAHPNPDTVAPFYIHWDVSGITEGDYEIRAVAHDLSGAADPSPAASIVAIDHGAAAAIDESINPGGRQERLTAIDDDIPTEAASGDAAPVATVVEWIAPAGAHILPADTLRLTFVDPAGEIPRLELPEQDLGIYIEVALSSGQTALENGLVADLALGYRDVDRDGVVDGSSIREEELELRRYDAASDSYFRAPSWTVLTEHDAVHGGVGVLGRYALLGPLVPRIAFLADGASITWPAVSEALSYRVYRGSLAALADGDGDGLPDAGYGACQNFRDPDPTDTLFFDDEVPSAPGQGFYYFVGFDSPEGERGLGNTSAGLPRIPAGPCP
jgi:hypothetical protein